MAYSITSALHTVHNPAYGKRACPAERNKYGQTHPVYTLVTQCEAL